MKSLGSIYNSLSDWQNNDPFYEYNLYKNNYNDYFYIDDISNELWTEDNSKYWHYVMNKNQLKHFPEQGWKIHITANINDASKLLYFVSKFLIHENISFKFIPNLSRLKLINSKYADRSESGKFITIYPTDIKNFIYLLNKLKNITNNFLNGPYILNDKQWRNSNVFFRYGAFKKMILKNGNNEYYDAIKTPNGNLIEDKRVPYYYLPKFVQEPEQIKQSLQKLDEIEVKKFNQYKNKQAIHYSNAGGVYKSIYNKKYYLLKEGRLHAGLDGNDVDGFNRINNEFNFLNILNDVQGIVKVFDKFKVWQHNYLVEEFTSGVNLDQYIVKYFPFVRDLSESKEKRINYKNNTKNIINQLIKIINECHEKNVAIGDLKNDNIIYSNKNKKITIIDLESANFIHSKYNPGLQTPGFIPKKSRNYLESDWYAVKSIAYNLFNPAIVMPNLSTSIYKGFKFKIKEEFGQDTVDFLNKLDLTISRHIDFEWCATGGQDSLTLPPYEINLYNRNKISKGIFKGIVKNLNFNSKYLMPPTPIQSNDIFSKLSIKAGTFGVIMAIIRSNNKIEDLIDKRSLKLWLDHIIPIVMNNTSDNGLFTGKSGIASIIFDLGYRKEALEIIDSIKIDFNSDDITIMSGNSGIGLNLLAFYTINYDEKLLKKSVIIAENLIQKLRKLNLVNISGGLLDGWSGVATFLNKLAVVINKEKKDFNNKYETYLKWSAYIINSILKYQIESDNKDYSMVIDRKTNKNRSLPYLSTGSVGLVFVIDELKSVNPFLNKNLVNKYLPKLTQIGYSSCSVYGGLFNGFSSFILFSSKYNSKYNDESMLKYTLNGLNSFLLGYKNEEILMPVDYGYKCSMDLYEGSSGALMAIDSIDKKNFNLWMPLPLKNKLNIFNT